VAALRPARQPGRHPAPCRWQGRSAAWLQARSERLGIHLDLEALRADGYEQHRGKADKLRISTIDFSGRFKVVDPQALRDAYFGGVGHAKAFGCGLLLVRPVHALS